MEKKIGDGLHYNIRYEFNNNGKLLHQILKEHFLLYMKYNFSNKDN